MVASTRGATLPKRESAQTQEVQFGGQSLDQPNSGMPLEPRVLVANETASRIMEQCKELSGSIESYTTAADKYFALVGTLGVGAIVALAKESSSQILQSFIVASPILLAIILHYVCQLLTEKAARAGMKQALEERLSTLQPGGILEIELHLSRTIGANRPSVVISVLLYSAVLVGTGIGAVNASIVLDGNHHGKVFWVLIFAMVSMAGTVIISASEMYRAHDRGLRGARESFHDSIHP